jgi:hypothetical protein
VTEPFSNGDNGRDERGRFAVGNAGGPGNPRARTARQLRDRLDDALFKTCSPDRLISAIDAVLKLAEAGDVAALKLLIERIAGSPVPSDVLDRLERIEEAFEQRKEE